LLARVPSKGAFDYIRVTEWFGRDRAIAEKAQGVLAAKPRHPPMLHGVFRFAQLTLRGYSLL
jgi:hypothetical protein